MDMKTALLLTYQTARSAQYAGQQLTLPWVERLVTGKKREFPEDFDNKRRRTLAALFELLKVDSANISAGLYPVEVLKPEGPAAHWGRYARILWDGWRISRRKENKNAHDFDQEAENYLRDVPEYYRRNFHFQTGGYLTKQSARLYEHQVEILFAGGGDAMRRLILPLMKQKWPGDGEGLHFLEVAAGTGRLTRFVKLAYPKARVTVSDLSWPYLQESRTRLADLDRVEFMQAAAEELPFKNVTYDAVYSCFLFHELPEQVRHQVVREGVRVLKPGGLYGLVDSLQKNDAQEFDWALEQFPTEFHEPFFKNYTLHPLENVLRAEGLIDVQKQHGFLAKGLVGTKPNVDPLTPRN